MGNGDEHRTTKAHLIDWPLESLLAGYLKLIWKEQNMFFFWRFMSSVSTSPLPEPIPQSHAQPIQLLLSSPITSPNLISWISFNKFLAFLKHLRQTDQELSSYKYSLIVVDLSSTLVYTSTPQYNLATYKYEYTYRPIYVSI